VRGGAPAPRPAPKPEPRAGAARRDGAPEEFSTLDTGDFEIVNHAPRRPPVLQVDDEGTGEVLLSTGDFEPADKPKPPRP